MIRRLFSFDGTVSRKEYILVALICVLTKQVLDMSVAWFAFHREWWPLNYIVPVGAPLTDLNPADRTFVLCLLALSIPFVWIGTALTVKRFRTIGWPAWLTVLFFVPVANLVSFAVAAAWPEHQPGALDGSPRWLRRVVPHDRLGAAIEAILLTVPLAVVLVAIATRVLSDYAWGLFAAIPFSQGALVSLAMGIHGRRNAWECVVAALLAVALTSAALIVVALDGLLCIAMAAPIAMAFAVVGALFGWALQNRLPNGGNAVASIIICILAAPAIMGAEAVTPREAPTYEVTSSVVIDAPPSVVWQHVIAFPDLPPPTWLPFRAGVAYPERARVVGRGVGAVRYCEFSTGNFVEPITAWEADRRLAFRVAHNAQPMRELSPYPGLDTAHLHDYLVSKHGEFDLEPLSGGRTRLIGHTWYQHHLWPALYWALFSDQIIHQIHMQVLTYIKHLSESKFISRPPLPTRRTRLRNDAPIAS